jgi:long-chain fatty acid transport protein
MDEKMVQEKSGKIVYAFLSVLMTAALFPSHVHGAGFAIAEQSASATGMACAVTGLADTPSAIYYNPAGIGMQKGLGAEAGVTFIVPLTSHKNPDTGEVTDAQKNLFYPPSVYINYRFPVGLAFGLGFFVPYGLGVQWPEGWEGSEEVESIELQTYFITPVVAWNILPWLSVGGGVSIVRSTVEFKKGINFVDEPGSLKAGGFAWNMGWDIGLLIRLLDGKVGFGLNYRSSVELGFTGNADFDVPLAFASLFEDQPVNTQVVLPSVLSMGISGKPHHSLTLSADVVATMWSSFEEFGLSFPEDVDKPPEEQLSRSEPRYWHDVWSLRFGVRFEPDFAKWLILRLGLAYDRNPSPSNTISPSLPDSDRIDGALGFGFLLRYGFRIDVSYMYVHFLERSSTPDAFPGTYQSSAHIASLSIGYRH